jgi:hypothetical protein
LQPFEEPTCRAASYDYSSQYLAVGGSDLRVYAPKQVRQHMWCCAWSQSLA